MSGHQQTAKAMAATGHRVVTDVALEILREGGNAFDAAVAAGFVSSIAEPALTSLGGGGFLLSRDARAHAILFDFFADTPGRGLAPGGFEPHFVPVTVQFVNSEQVFHIGLGSVAVPGMLKGLLHVHERLGRIPLEAVLAPAVDLARSGVDLNEEQAGFLELLRPILTHTDTARALYFPDERPRRAGDRFTNPDLADFLECVPDGAARDFHEGALGRRIAQDMRDGRGLLGEEDLAQFTVIERAPLEFPYRGHTVLTNPPPAFGGSLLGLAFSLLEEALDVGSSDREHALALLDVLGEVDRRRAEGFLNPGPGFTRGTTHVSVCDTEGNVASMTTSNGEGAGYIVPGTGILLNNMLGEDDLHPDGFHAAPPGQRVASMMSPALVLRGRDVRLALGTGGSKRIVSALLQVISLVVDRGLDLAEAIEYPRLHREGDLAHLEPGLSEATVAALSDRWSLNVWERASVYFGGVHAVAPGVSAAADPRRGGWAQVGG